MKSLLNIRHHYRMQSFQKLSINRMIFKKFSDSLKKGKIIMLAENGSLDEILKNSTTPVMIDFFADWCPPCKKLTPVLESNFNKKQNFTLVKVNVDEHHDLSSKYGVTGIPHVVLVHNQKNVSKFVGYDERGLTGMLESIDKMNKL